MREMRAMCFGEAEALKALIARAQKSREKLPQGQVKLDLMPDDPPIIRLIFTDDYGRRETLSAIRPTSPRPWSATASNAASACPPTLPSSSTSSKARWRC